MSDFVFKASSLGGLHLERYKRSLHNQPTSHLASMFQFQIFVAYHNSYLLISDVHSFNKNKLLSLIFDTL